MRTTLSVGIAILCLGLPNRAAGQDTATGFAGSPAQWAAAQELGPVGPALADVNDGLSGQSSGGSRREGTVLMIVGAAGIITGLIIDESVVTILGVGVAGVGLYLYLHNGGKVVVGAFRP